MIYVALSIVFSTITVLFFKLFERYKVDLLQGIISNYVMCMALGFLLISDIKNLPLTSDFSIYGFVLILGFLFIGIFFAIAKTAQLISVSASMVAAKLSVVVPVLAAFLLYGESLSSEKIAGIVLSLIAVILISKKDKKQPNNKWWLLPVIVFVGSGLIDTLLKHIQKNFIPPLTEAFIVSMVFSAAFLFGMLYLTGLIIKNKTTIQFKNILWGLALGLPNYFSMYFLVKTLTLYKAGIIFPINNIGIVGLSSFAGFWLFKEKLNASNKLGLAIALVSILIISTL